TRAADGGAACVRLALLLNQHVVALHQRGQSRVEAEIAELLGYALDGLVAQALDSQAFTGLFSASMLNPGIIDQAPEAVQEAPDTLQVFGQDGAACIDWPDRNQ